MDNIAFFSQTDTLNSGGNSLTLANCTFENPCGPVDFSQPGVGRLADLLPNTVMYFNGGSYPANSSGNPITLSAGQSIHSRTADYSQPAIDTARSTFNGRFVLNSYNTLENIILLPISGGGSSYRGIFTNINANNIVIRNSQIGSETHPFPVGFYSDNGINAALINNNDIYANLLGIGVFNSPSALIALSVQNSRINVNGSLGYGIGIGDTVVNLENSQINVVGDYAAGINSSHSTIITADSKINVTGGYAAGVFASNSTVATAYHITVNVTGNQTRALFSLSGSRIHFDQGSLSVTGTGSQINDGNNIQTTSSMCMMNGVVIPCS